MFLASWQVRWSLPAEDLPELLACCAAHLIQSKRRGKWEFCSQKLQHADVISCLHLDDSTQEHRKPAVTEPGEMLPELISCPLGVPPQPATLLPASEDPPRPQTQPPASFLLLRVGDGASDVPCNIVAEQQEMEGDGNNLPSHSTHASQAQVFRHVC